MEGRTKVILEKVVPEIGPLRYVKKALFLEDVVDYEEDGDHNKWTKVFINGEYIFINMSFQDFDRMYDEEMRNSNLGLL